MSVAGNGEAPKVPLFGQSTGGFPGGFETQIVGPSGGRQILTRLVLLAGSSRHEDVVTEVRRMHTARDL